MNASEYVDALARKLYEARGGGRDVSITVWEDAGPTCRAFYRRLARVAIAFTMENKLEE